jgi:hypothetical protein
MGNGPFHLGDLVRLVDSYRADQQVEARVVEILHKSKDLTASQMRLLDRSLQDGQSLSLLRHDPETLSGFTSSASESTRAMVGKMLGAIDQAAAERRTWSNRKWAIFLNCQIRDVPDPATMVTWFDYKKIAHAIQKILEETDVVVADGDVVETSIFDFVTNEILKRVPSGLEIARADLRWYATRDVLNLDRPNQVSQFIADLHNQGLTDALLIECWEKYPAESEAIGLPNPSQKPLEDSDDSPTAIAFAAIQNARPLWTEPPPDDRLHKTPLVGPLGLEQGSLDLSLGSNFPEARYEDAPQWFRDFATEAGKLLYPSLAKKQCTAIIEKTIGAGVGQMQRFELFDEMEERPRGDWYVILFGAHDLFVETPLLELQGPMCDWFTGLKECLKKAATDDAQGLMNLLQKALDYVRRDLRKSGLAIGPSEELPKGVEDRSTANQLTALEPPPPAGPKQFTGPMIFFEDRVELCGVVICSGRRSKYARAALDALCEMRNGTFVAYTGNELAKKIGLHSGAQGIFGLIRDIRDKISVKMLGKANIRCDKFDVILSGCPGYMFSPKLTVQLAGQKTEDGVQAHYVENDDPDDPKNHDPNDTKPGDPDDPKTCDDPDPGVTDDPDSENMITLRRAWILTELAAGRDVRADGVVRKFGCSKITAKRDFRTLKSKGRIDFDGSRRSGKYRLTEPSVQTDT